ncbi:tripartite tricarboxylate transporter permease [Candidatus Woesearchaeota archaeon]|nr:tripartite tricarboxylate transporter permease [Candidatus Woesearchaeota archaeon]
MYLEIIAAIILGMLSGIVTGLTPGIHVNLVATTLLALSPFLLRYTSPFSLAAFIMSLAVVHSFLDTIPSTYLGAPESENALSVLPAQKMLLKGEGYMAVKLTILGTYSGLILALLLVPLFIFIANWLYPILKPYLLYLLLMIVAFMLFREKEKIWSTLLFMTAGTLGVIVFSLPNLAEPLFPLLSGMFGISGLLISYFENTKIPVQKFTKEIDLTIKELGKVLMGSSLAVFLIQFFPGMGPSQGAVISNQIVKDIKDKAYLALIGAMGTMSVIFSLVTFYALGKAKDGSIVVMEKLFEIDTLSFVLLLLVFFIAGSVSVFLTLFFAKQFSKLIVKVNYKALVVSIIAFIVLMCAFLNGWVGLVVLATASAVGLIAPLKNIPRNHAMGCLLVPVLVYLIMAV